VWAAGTDGGAKSVLGYIHARAPVSRDTYQRAEKERDGGREGDVHAVTSFQI